MGETACVQNASLYYTILWMKACSYFVNMSVSKVNLNGHEQNFGVVSGFAVSMFFRLFVAMYTFLFSLTMDIPAYVSYRHGKRFYTLAGTAESVITSFNHQKSVYRKKVKNNACNDPIIMLAFLGTVNVLQRLEEFLGPHGMRHDLSRNTALELFPEAKHGQKLQISMFSKTGIEQQAFEVTDNLVFAGSSKQKTS